MSKFWTSFLRYGLHPVDEFDSWKNLHHLNSTRPVSKAPGSLLDKSFVEVIVDEIE